MIVKPCPFCGKKVDLEDHDVLYPSGTGWKQEDGFRSYHRYSEVPKEQWCYTMHCTSNSGGCGAEMSGDSKEEALEKWNRRVYDLEYYCNVTI